MKKIFWLLFTLLLVSAAGGIAFKYFSDRREEYYLVSEKPIDI